MGETMIPVNYMSWQPVDNVIQEKMINGSLLHTLKGGKKIRRRTKILNERLKKHRVLKSYKEYVKRKTIILRNIPDNDETDDQLCTEDEDEITCAFLEKEVSCQTDMKQPLDSNDSIYSLATRKLRKTKARKSRELIGNIGNIPTKKLRKTKVLRSVQLVDNSTNQIINENDLSTTVTKLCQSNSEELQQYRKQERLNPEVTVTENLERDKTQKKNSEIMNLNTPVNISQAKTLANAKRNLTSLLNGMDETAQKPENDEIKASEINSPLKQSTQLIDTELEYDTQFCHKGKNRYSLSLSKYKSMKNTEHDESKLKEDVQEISSIHKVIENENDSQRATDENKHEAVEDIQDISSIHHIIKDENDSQAVADENEHKVEINPISAIKLKEPMKSEVEEETEGIIEEYIPKESIHNESITKKSQPVIKSTEIVKSKYTIIRDDEEKDEIAVNFYRNSLDSPNYITSQDEDVEESDELTPETRRLRQLKRINLLSSSYDSDSSDDTFKTKRDREDVMIWAKEEIPQNITDFDSTFGSLDSDISDEESIASLDHNEIKEPEASEVNHSNDTGSQNLVVTKSLKSQIKEQMKDVDVHSRSEENKEQVKGNGKEVENDDGSSDFGLTLEELSSDETSANIEWDSSRTPKRDVIKQCENGMNSDSKKHRWLSTSNSFSNAQPTEAESLQCILKNMAKTNNNNDENDLHDCSFRGYNQPVYERKEIAARDCSEELNVETMPRSVELNEYTERQGLICNSDSSSITLKDIKNCIDENDDEELWIMEVPKSVVVDANLCGRKIVLKKKTVKIGDVSYDIICRQDEPLSCIFRSKKKKIRYKTVNITPIGSIVIQNELSTMETTTPSKLSRHSQDSAASSDTNVVPFPKNIKSRNPLLPLNVSKELIDQTIADSQESQANIKEKANNANESNSKSTRKRKSNKFGAIEKFAKTKGQKVSSGISRKRKGLKRSDGAVKKIESRRTVTKKINDKLKKIQKRWSLQNFVSKSKKRKAEFPWANKSSRKSL